MSFMTFPLHLLSCSLVQRHSGTVGTWGALVQECPDSASITVAKVMQWC